MSSFYQENNKYPDEINDFIVIDEDILIEYGEIANLFRYIVSRNYRVNSDVDSKYYVLSLFDIKK